MRTLLRGQRLSLSLRLRLAFLGLGLTAIVSTGALAFHIAQGALEQATYERLTGVRETKKRQIESYLHDALAIVRAIGRDESAVDAFWGVQAAWPPSSDDYQAVLALHHEGLAGLTGALGFEDLLLIEPEHGAALYSTRGAAGRALTDPVDSDTALAQAVSAVLADPSTARLADYQIYPSTGELAAFAVAAIRKQNEVLGALAARLSIKKIDEVMTGNGRWRAEGLGESGETYLVGADHLMRSDSRFLIESPKRYFEQLRSLGYGEERIELIQRRGTTVLTQRAETAAVERALAGETATNRILDYRGVEVLSSFAPLELPDLRWSLLSEIDVEEAFRPVTDLRNRLIVLGAAISLVFVALGYLFARRTTEPLLELTDAVERLGRQEWKQLGGLTAFAKADDEVARLAQEFDAVSRRLQETTVSRDHLDNLLASMLNAVITIGPIARREAEDSGSPILIRSANPAAHRLLEYSNGEMNGLPIQRILDSKTAVPRWLDALRRDGRSPVVEKLLVTKSGRRIPVLFAVAFVGSGGGDSDAVCVAQDITERKAAEQQLQALAQRLIVAQEEERGRLARELHDDVTQRLGALAIDAGKLAGDLVNEPAVAPKLRGLQESAIRLAHDVQGLSRRLHPSILSDLGLVAALRAEVQALRDRSELAVSFAAEEPPASFPRESALALYRAAQECFHNIGRHSGAKEVNVELTVINGSVRLSIEDDGLGFDPGATRRRGGLGLASLDERARLAGGSLQIRSQPGQGARITVEVPVTP